MSNRKCRFPGCDRKATETLTQSQAELAVRIMRHYPRAYMYSDKCAKSRRLTWFGLGNHDAALTDLQNAGIPFRRGNQSLVIYVDLEFKARNVKRP